MYLTIVGLIFMGLVVAYIAYALRSTWGYGVGRGDDGQDMRAGERSSALTLAVLGLTLMVATVGCLAVGSDEARLAALAAWLRQF
jgi:hypothetical protein